MSKSIYTIYDQKAETYFPPSIFRNNGEALRSLSQEMENNDSLLSTCPEDYSLIKLGSWEEDKGIITTLPVPEIVMHLVELKKN